MAMPEIISPAGNLEKLKFAVRYGADAVYLGGDRFNLRIKSGNFSDRDITEGLSFCKEHGVKTVFLLNSFLHEKDLGPAREYLEELKKHPFDAVMVSDPGMMALVRDAGIGSRIHLSTQMNTLNHLSIRFWNEAGIDRIVLGRETSLDEIKKIRDNTEAEIEIFVHGALCISYSGRCLLSRYLTGRDANQGDCAQSCRWNYALIEKMRPGNFMDIIEHESGTEIISSKDLCLVERLKEYADAGVNAFKIEGRMKSLYYTANITRIYRHALRHAGSEKFKELLPFYRSELDLISHRPYTDNLFNEFNDMGYGPIPYIKKALFLGYTPDAGENGRVPVKVFNPIRIGEKIEAIYPIHEDIRDAELTVKDIHDEGGVISDMARPGEISHITFDSPVGNHAIFRKRIVQSE